MSWICAPVIVIVNERNEKGCSTQSYSDSAFPNNACILKTNSKQDIAKEAVSCLVTRVYKLLSKQLLDWSFKILRVSSSSWYCGFVNMGCSKQHSMHPSSKPMTIICFSCCNASLSALQGRTNICNNMEISKLWKACHFATDNAQTMKSSGMVCLQKSGKNLLW